MALITCCHGKGILIIMTDAAELPLIHGVHRHLLYPFFHRPDGCVALVALKDLCMEFVAEDYWSRVLRLIYDRPLGQRHLCMAIRGVGRVGERLLAVMTGETELSGSVIGKCDFDAISFHGEQRHMARIASKNGNMDEVLVFDCRLTRSECNRPLRIQAFSIPVTSQAVLIGRWMLVFRPFLVMAIETYLHVRPIAGDAAMGYFGVTDHTIYPHVEMLPMMRINFSRGSHRLDGNIWQAALLPEFRVLDAVY